eukprot:snap_masked-scaffold_76-processed-gene-0.18-mRNA-1 protein AED:1.00 eAED:1.00 QI:0/0/0/0/1/1/2/0/71
MALYVQSFLHNFKGSSTKKFKTAFIKDHAVLFDVVVVASFKKQAEDGSICLTTDGWLLREDLLLNNILTFK